MTKEKNRAAAEPVAYRLDDGRPVMREHIVVAKIGAAAYPYRTLSKSAQIGGHDIQAIGT